MEKPFEGTQRNFDINLDKEQIIFIYQRVKYDASRDTKYPVRVL